LFTIISNYSKCINFTFAMYSFYLVRLFENVLLGNIVQGNNFLLVFYVCDNRKYFIYELLISYDNVNIHIYFSY